MRLVGPFVLIALVVLASACSSNKPAPPPEPPPASPEPTPSGRDLRRVYIGDVSTHVFHRGEIRDHDGNIRDEGCPELEAVDLSDQRLLEDPGEGLDRGFSPCKVCRPLHGW